MAQSKFNDLAGKFPKGAPPGLGLALKFAAGIGLAAYTASQSVYTGKLNDISQFAHEISTPSHNLYLTLKIKVTLLLLIS